MKKKIFLVIVLISQLNFGQFNYQKAWATYFFGSRAFLGESRLDSNGNLIISGSLEPYLSTTDYATFTTAGSSMPQLLSNTIRATFLAKFSPNGDFLWGTYISQYSNLNSYVGGAGFDLDSNNNIYLIGGTNQSSGISTQNTFMPVMPIQDLPSSAANIKNDGFIIKLDPLGNKLWGTYFPGTITDLKIDNNDNLLFSGKTEYASGIATTGSYQENLIPFNNIVGGEDNYSYFIEKFDPSGNRIAGTYLGIALSRNDFIMLDVDANNDILFLTAQKSFNNTTVATANCHQPTMNGNVDNVIIKMNNDLSQKIWGTFYGGTFDDKIAGIKTDGTDIYVFGNSFSMGLGTTGVFQEDFFSNNNYYARAILTKFDQFGQRLWCTYLGCGNYTSTYVRNIDIKNNKILLVGSIRFGNSLFINNCIVTSGSYQEIFGGNSDLFLVELNKNNGTRNWGSYFGGENFDDYSTTTINFNSNNNFYITGTTNSTTDIATAGSFQENLLFSPTSTSILSNQNIFIAKFEPIPLSDKTFNKNNYQLSPNPNNGSFTVTGNFNENAILTLYDNLGREFISRKIENNRSSQTFNLENELKSGVYFVKLVDENDLLQTFKVLVE